MSEATPAAPARRLEEFRAAVAARVAESGDPDAEQVAVEMLAWCHAHAAAAEATRAWAAATGDPLAAMVAEAAEDEALAALDGRGAAAEVEAGRRWTAIAERLAGGGALEDLGASAEHRLLRSSLREFAEAQIRPVAQDIHRGDLDIPEDLIGSAAELGLFGLSVPPEHGGSAGESGARSMLIITEELSRASLAAGGSLVTRPEILVRALLRGGTEQQRRHWLPQIASGARLVAVAVTEPDHGSDVAGIRCRAVRREDGSWVINGTKLWCTFAGRSELLMLLCRTGGDGHRGLSLFVVEKPAFAGHAFEDRQPGGGRLRARAIPTIGYRGMHTFELAFEDYVVPAEALVGGEEQLGRGFYLQMEGFAMGRIQTAGRAVGLMQAALDGALEQAMARKTFGRPIFEYPLVRARLGRAAVRVHAARRLSYVAADRLDAGAGAVEASVAKLYASRMAELVTRDAMQVHGAMGYAEETEASRHFVDARVLAIFEGAEEVLALRVIGRSLVGA